MRTINLSKSGLNKIHSRQIEFKSSDFEDSIKSIPPGEWCIVKLSTIEHGVIYLNPLVDEKFACGYLVHKLRSDDIARFEVETFIFEKIKMAIEKRKLFRGYEKNSRVFYGASDGLPGLIIDLFENISIIQINTAGLDRFRDKIKIEVERLTEKKSYYLDNSKYREKESLPFFENQNIPGLEVLENGIKFKIRPEVLQKIGFYYDHRENRYQLMNLLSRMNVEIKSALDLFCYVGAWGVSALKVGAQNCQFVDQGDFEIEVNQSLQLNNLKGKGNFLRTDVFKFLDDSFQKNQKYDLVLCDPPAFAKSMSQKNQALEGYSKLHRKVFKICSNQAIVSFSSCTHYVNHEEFQKNISEAAKKENRKIQLIYVGTQGFDHPMESLSDRSNYIKCYFYIVE